MRYLATLLAGLVALPVLAGPAPEPSDAPPARHTAPYLSASGGWMESDEGALGAGAGLDLGVGLGWGVRRWLAFEFEVGTSLLDYSAPDDAPEIFLGSVNDVNVSTMSLAFVVKGRWPLGRFRPYVAAGPGVSFAKAELTGSMLGIPGTFEEDRDVTILLQAAAGFDLRLTTRSHLGLEYRWVDADASFGDIVSGSIPIGGDAVRLVYAYDFY